jgi:hypothetical protein
VSEHPGALVHVHAPLDRPALTGLFRATPDQSRGGATVRLDRLSLGAAAAGLLASLGLHLALLAGLPAAPVPPWSWLLHATAVVLGWRTLRRVSAGGFSGLQGLLRIRRMVPIPVRLCLGAATTNALVAAWLAWSYRAVPGQAATAYWVMMYCLVAVLVGFVVRRLPDVG